jgi:hypothetical protein
MKFVISRVGANRIITGSDDGFGMGYEQPVACVGSSLSSDERQMIPGRTAAKVLKLIAPGF